jgi:phosphatidate cytidylyltransferase
MAYVDRNMIVRITTTVVAIPLIVAIVAAGGWWIYGALVVVGALVFWEYGSVVSQDDAFARNLLVVVGTTVVGTGCLIESAAGAILVPQLGALAIAIVFTLRSGDLSTVWNRMSSLAFGVVYVGLAHVALYRLRAQGNLLPANTSAVVWVWLPLASAWGSDSVAYFVGKAFGKTKMIPKLSPKKTWEGFIGGAIGAVGLPFALLMAFKPWLVGVSALDIFFVTVPAIFLAPIGDLIESMMKRSYDAKDAGHLLPGHGGFLDRVDAVYVVAPWTLFYVAVLRPYVTG